LAFDGTAEETGIRNGADGSRTTRAGLNPQGVRGTAELTTAYFMIHSWF
jgi:hypothetical protein